jgi:ornithine carbamoyltransferase
MQKFGGNVIELDSKAIGFGKRESEEDILKTLSCYIDCLMIRNNNHKKIQYYASLNVLPIINGLSEYSHPCQILADIFTLKEKLGKLSNKTVCWIGDFNNVLRSLIQAQHLYLFQLNIVMPKNILRKIKSSVNKTRHSKIKFTDDINKSVMKSDCVMTDVWISMGEKNRKKKSLFKNYQVNNKVMQLAKKNAIFMHCLPAHRGEEVSNNVIDSHKFCFLLAATQQIDGYQLHY